MGDAKKPQDHKKKTEIIAGKIQVQVRGIKLEIDKDALDDFELLDDLAAVQNEDSSRIPLVLRRLVGGDFKKVMNGLRDERGRVPIEAGTEFIKELFEAVNPNS